MTEAQETDPPIEIDVDDLQTTLAMYKHSYKLLAERHGALIVDHERLKRSARDLRRVTHKARLVKPAEYARVRKEFSAALGEREGCS